MFRHPTSREKHTIRTANESFENVTTSKHYGTILANNANDEIEGRFNWGNVCYHSVQNALSSRLTSKNLNIKIYKTINLPVVL
jgi:hypothetical protein